MRIFVLFLLVSLTFACNKRSNCPAYRDLPETQSVLEGGSKWEPTEYVIVDYSKKTGLVKKTGNVRKLHYSNKWTQSKLEQRDKRYIRDEELLPNVKQKRGKPKKVKKAKKEKKSKSKEVKEETK